VLIDQRPGVSPHRTAPAVGLLCDGIQKSGTGGRRREQQLIDISCKITTVALMPTAVRFDSYGGVDVLDVEMRHTRGTLVLRP
jgi:hypothetical protein